MTKVRKFQAPELRARQREKTHVKRRFKWISSDMTSLSSFETTGHLNPQPDARSAATRLPGFLTSRRLHMPYVSTQRDYASLVYHPIWCLFYPPFLKPETPIRTQSTRQCRCDCIEGRAACALRSQWDRQDVMPIKLWGID